MKRIVIILCALFSLTVKAVTPPDEGMWLPMFVERLNYVDMQKMGLHLTPEELYSINHSSLKDAVVSLGGFCTAEVVSPEGLLLTNHHCGYDAIQKHSTNGLNYLDNGFWAMNKNEELPNEGLFVAFLDHMEDMTKEVLSVVTPDMTEAARIEAVTKKVAELKKAASQNGKFMVDLKSFYSGNEYYMFVYNVYKDIRLVGAPPESIGKFGGDTDNWMWPRHTGDFSMFRIYTAPDGSPAEYSKDNVPMKAKKFLKVSLKGYKKDDFAMIWGFPGTTDRYRNSYGVAATLNEIDPVTVKMLGTILDKQKEGMDADPKVRLMYASDYAGLANYWKNKLGEMRDLKRLNVIGKKQELEAQLQDWINADPARLAKYGSALNTAKEVFQQYTNDNLYTRMMHLQAFQMGSKMYGMAGTASGLETALKSGEKGDALKKQLDKYREIAAEQYKDYDIGIEKNVLAALLKLMKSDIPVAQQPDNFKAIDAKYKGNMDAFADMVSKKSIFASKANFEAFLAKPSLKKLTSDPLYMLNNSVMESLKSLRTQSMQLQTKNNEANRKFVAALREMQPNKSFYPDANSTLRMTYGKVLDYYPADGVHYNYYTTLDGVMAKEDPTNPEFIVPSKLKQLYQVKDYGRYGENGKMLTCFLTDNDITGGNSGSPVMNGDGHLLGIAFDGNWEAMSGNILFEPELQRTICVDIRYVLFVIDKYAGAKHLVDEMTLVE